MVFLQPGFLFLLLAAAIIWLLPVRLMDWRHGLLRSAALVLLAIAIAQPVTFGEDAGAWQVLVVDSSESVADERARDRALRAWAGTFPDDDHLALVVVGENDVPDIGVDRLAFTAKPGRTPLDAALDAAGRSIPIGARGAVTVLSDGRSTSRHWGRALQDLTARGIPVHALALPSAQDDLAPVRFEALDTLRVGQTGRLRVDVVGRAAAAFVKLRAGAADSATQSAPFGVQNRATVTLEFEPQQAGFISLEIEVVASQGPDANPDNNTMRRTFAVQDPIRVCYLGERVVNAPEKLGALLGSGFEIGGTRDAAKLGDYDVILVDDVPAQSLPEPFQKAVDRAVTEGGVGLMVAGGRASFGAGGYDRSTLAELMPVEFVQKEEKRDPSTTLVVIIDTSGSMGGNRVQLAKEVARLAIRRLLPYDKVGIVEFYGAKRWAAPIQPASNAIEIQRALNRLNAGGGTVILPAIEEAFYGLQNVQTRYKHVLVLTDGGVERGSFEPLLRRMADKGINVSTVLIGPTAHSEFLVSLANWGKGRFYSVPNRFNLPEIIVKQPASARLPAYRPGRHPVTPMGGASWWQSIDPASVPPLSGYVETRARDGAETLLEVTQTGHPVLCTWRYGLGRVTTLATEPTGPGTATWADWDGYGAMLARVLSRTASDLRPPYAFALTRRGDALTLRAERVDRHLTASAALPTVRVLANGEQPERQVVFRKRAEGLYTSTWSWPAEVEAQLVAQLENGVRVRLVSNAREDVSDETQVDPAAALAMRAVAGATQGGYVDWTDGASIPTASGGGAAPVSVRPLWPFCALAALLIYLSELFYRRRGQRRTA